MSLWLQRGIITSKPLYYDELYSRNRENPLQCACVCVLHEHEHEHTHKMSKERNEKRIVKSTFMSETMKRTSAHRTHTCVCMK